MLELPNSFVSVEEWTHLVHLCASMTGNSDVAEDLAQETLLEAWQRKESLREKEKRVPWLFGIARNLCLRWLRKQGRHATQLIAPAFNLLDHDAINVEDMLADQTDIEVELERKELAELLDRALTLLPVETRTLLVKRYIEDFPLSEIAAQLGTSDSTAAMRLHRGKLILRRVLTTDLQDELALYIPSVIVEQWEETPFWCYHCGRQRLLGKRDALQGDLFLKCPSCSPGSNEMVSDNRHLSVLKGVKSYKPLHARLLGWCNSFYRTALHNGGVRCESCGRFLPAHIARLEDLPQDAELSAWVNQSNERLIFVFCQFCRSTCVTSVEGISLALPEAQRFRQAHPRIRTLPNQQIEFSGRPAVVSRFQSVTDSAALIVISDYETYQVLSVEEGTL